LLIRAKQIRGNGRVQESDEQRWSALMASAQSGNESDYRVLLGELADVVQRFLRSRFGDHHFIEDCVQESLIAIHQARHTYNPKRPFRPWMFAIVRNKAIDSLRSRQRREKMAKQYQREQKVLSEPGRPLVSAEDFADGQWVQSLSEQHREVLILTKIIGFSIAETAKRLEISQAAVKVRVHRAMAKLRHQVAKEGW
jgi:RNA polymerase sigma-70 factor (ECF subfamily)